jgi:hypothetical protein
LPRTKINRLFFGAPLCPSIKVPARITTKFAGAASCADKTPTLNAHITRAQTHRHIQITSRLSRMDDYKIAV